jgi:hypothetical protein
MIKENMASERLAIHSMFSEKHDVMSDREENQFLDDDDDNEEEEDDNNNDIKVTGFFDVTTLYSVDTSGKNVEYYMLLPSMSMIFSTILTTSCVLFKAKQLHLILQCSHLQILKSHKTLC